MAKKHPHSEALKLIERLVAITPEKDDGLKVYLMGARDRIKTPMTAVLAKVPGNSIGEKCAKIGITRQNYHAWLRGVHRPGIKQAKRLAQITGFDFEDIRGRGLPAA